MKRVVQIVLRGVWLISLLAPIVGVVLYPRANWLFAFLLVGIVFFLINVLAKKDPTPAELADHAEGLLSGSYTDWDVDDYEHTNPRDPRVKELWHRTMAVGGLPEEWVDWTKPRKANCGNSFKN